jgi:hypothetical protein
MNTIATFFFFYLPRLIIYRRRHFFELFPFVSLFRTILAQFTEGQMSRYESFRRSALQKTNMKRVCFPIACIFLLFSYYIFFFFCLVLEIYFLGAHGGLLFPPASCGLIHAIWIFFSVVGNKLPEILWAYTVVATFVNYFHSTFLKCLIKFCTSWFCYFWQLLPGSLLACIIHVTNLCTGWFIYLLMLTWTLYFSLMAWMQLLVSITGSQKISLPMTIVVCGIAKMFVGELVETGVHIFPTCHCFL